MATTTLQATPLLLLGLLGTIALSTLGLLLLAGIATYLLVPKATLAAKLPLELRTAVEKRWHKAADQYADEEEWQEAESIYDDLIALEPTFATYWQLKAHLQILDERPEEALETLDRAVDHINRVNKDMIELELVAASQTDHTERAKHALGRLARKDRELADRLVESLELQDLAKDPDLDHLVGPRLGGGGIDGYA